MLINSMFSIRLNIQQHSIKLTAMKAYFHYSKGQTSPCVFDTVGHVHSNPSFSWKNRHGLLTSFSLKNPISSYFLMPGYKGLFLLA